MKNDNPKISVWIVVFWMVLTFILGFLVGALIENGSMKETAVKAGAAYWEVNTNRLPSVIVNFQWKTNK